MKSDMTLWQILDDVETGLLLREVSENVSLEDAEYEKARIQAVAKWLEDRSMEEFGVVPPDVRWVCSELLEQAKIDIDEV